MTELFKGKCFLLEQDGDLGILNFDMEGERVNTLSHKSIGELEEILNDFSKKYAQIKALIIRSAKKDSFIVGADLNLVRSMSDRSEAEDASRGGQKAFNLIEDLGIPVISAIHGACMGGGTELSAACTYRVCSDSSKTMIAVPEVKLGFLPGWGGTYRLPKIVGLGASLDMMLTGKNIRPAKAPKIGLVSLVIPEAIFDDECRKLGHQLASGKVPFKAHQKPSIVKSLSTDPSHILQNYWAGRRVVFQQAKATVVKQTRGNYPAPFRILEVVEKAWGKKRDEALDLEAAAFADLWATPESKNLVGLFFLNESAKKDTGVSLSNEEVKALAPIQEVAVLGAGVMGGGIASQSASKGMKTLVKDINWESVQKAIIHANKLAETALSKKQVTLVEKNQWMNRIHGQIDYSGFKACDLVIEAVVENMDIKKAVFKEVEAAVGPDCIIASNTSSLRVSEMAPAFKDPSRLVGLHFFNPVHRMPLVEVISHDQASEASIARAVKYVKSIGKTPVVVKDGPGFLVNRILMPWLNEAGYCLLEGYGIESMDKILKKFGMPMGPCELLDEIGLDVGAKVAKILFQDLGERSKPSDAIEKILSENTEGNANPRLGRKSGLGLYKWSEKGGKRLEPDVVGIHQLLFNGSAPQTPEHTPESLIRRQIFPMINEAAEILKEGLTAGPEQVDLAMIFGTGFAPFRGGLCRYADSVGLELVVAELERLSDQHGPRLAPSEALKELAKNGGKFYSE
ncbi:fatty acid oxidation complex subunit alpha FadJ [bacterium]|nr:fatty acid oxidation complex subunit alpha FadJ [bacterium]